ncbi:hypothetical protein EIP91_007301 [Steccherinum ochraceum]|uniref:Uncharacterized protein n=1 Tax=Steccherinum ochraceum TaxID=92696 RepID=A0A4R0R6Q1_9APHY|nr:hypothetical protein EIP91_007301 [Steccherinum ochraceum]
MDFTVSGPNGIHLSVKRRVVEYTQDGFTFSYYASCVSPSREDCSGLPADSLTLVIAHGLGLYVETYYPMISHLYARSHDPNSPFRIRAVWLIEHANHNDSSMLNESTLKSHYTKLFPIQYFGHGIVAFLKSGLVDLHDPNLIPVAHCGGAGGMVLAVDTLFRHDRFQPRCAILIEPLLFDRRVEAPFRDFTNRVHVYNKKREHLWQNVDEAIAYHTKKHPWNTWDLEVLRWMSRSAFRTVPSTISPNNKPFVTLKTSLQQESASFEFDGPLIAGSVLLELIPKLPVHIIMAEKQNMWSPPMYENQVDLLDRSKSQLASFRVISGAGHCAPQDNPVDSAAALFEALLADYTRCAAQTASSQTAKL